MHCGDTKRSVWYKLYSFFSDFTVFIKFAVLSLFIQFIIFCSLPRLSSRRLPSSQPPYWPVKRPSDFLRMKTSSTVARVAAPATATAGAVKVSMSTTPKTTPLLARCQPMQRLVPRKPRSPLLRTADWYPSSITTTHSVKWWSVRQPTITWRVRERTMCLFFRDSRNRLLAEDCVLNANIF